MILDTAAIGMVLRAGLVALTPSGDRKREHASE